MKPQHLLTTGVLSGQTVKPKTRLLAVGGPFHGQTTAAPANRTPRIRAAGFFGYYQNVNDSLQWVDLNQEKTNVA